MPFEVRERAAALIQIALGLWLMVAPLALGYVSADPRGGTVACGAALALLGLWRLAGPRGATSAAPWLCACVATTVLAVASLADRSGVAATNDAIVGVATWMAVIGAGWQNAP
jgi:hypothetical protein